MEFGDVLRDLRKRKNFSKTKTCVCCSTRRRTAGRKTYRWRQTSCAALKAMTEVFVYPVNLPLKVREMVVPSEDGYTVYLNAMHSTEVQLAALHHALEHIQQLDWEKPDAIQIEADAHKKTPPALPG